VRVQDNGRTGISQGGGPIAVEDGRFVNNGIAGLVIGKGGRGRIVGAVFEDGPGLSLADADTVSVTGSRFARSTVAVEIVSTPFSLRYNRFEDNQTAVRVLGAPPEGVIASNVFLANGVAMDNRTRFLLDARDGYWGTVDSTSISAQMRGKVDWMPFLTSEPVATAVVGRAGVSPTFALGAPFPNPFNGQVILPYVLPEPGTVTVVVYDMLGRVVRRLVAAAPVSGVGRLAWDGRNDRGQCVASGVYLYRLRTGVHTGWGRIVLMR